MYRINGYIPVVRCVCGRKHVLLRATVCGCGATLRVRYTRKVTSPYGIGPDSYDLAAQPYPRIELIDWRKAEGCTG